jgi:hypothetical protein
MHTGGLNLQLHRRRLVATLDYFARHALSACAQAIYSESPRLISARVTCVSVQFTHSPRVPIRILGSPNCEG